MYQFEKLAAVGMLLYPVCMHTSGMGQRVVWCRITIYKHGSADCHVPILGLSMQGRHSCQAVLPCTVT